jgi:hypothetical protein
MTNLLDSLKSDLLDRRLLPLLVLLGLALAGAVAYAVFGGGSGTTGAPSAAVVPVGHSAAGTRSAGSSLAVSQATADPHAAVAETTEGSRYQHQSGAHDPFKPIVSAEVSSAKAASASPASATGSGAASSTSTSTTSSGTGSATTGGGGTTPTQPTEPAPTKPKPAKPAHVYFVDVLFGLAPTTPGQFSQLTPYANLKRLEPLPSVSEPRVIFAGVSDTGRGAVFALAGEAILKGEGACLPSETQCEAVDLGIGKSEEFDYLQASGQTIAYELQVVSISVHQASAAAAARLDRRDRRGQALLRHLSAPVLHHLHFSSAKGVLVYVAHHGG